MEQVNLADNRQNSLRVTNIALVVLAVAFVVLRFVSRRMKGLSTGSDDIFILVALFWLFAAFAACMIGIHYGMGRHMGALTNDQIVAYAKSLISFECLYVTCICFTKISILLMYCRIFPVRTIRVGAVILGAISIAWCISIIMVSIFQCTPIRKTWNPALPGHCINLKGSFIGNAVPNILTDFAILALPMKEVWGLHTSRLQKTQITVVFLQGSFVIFTSIYRFSTLFQFQPADVTWTLATAETWCVVESSAGIISACLPTLGHLFQAVSRIIGLQDLSWSRSRAYATRGQGNSNSHHLATIGGTSGQNKISKNTGGSKSDDSILHDVDANGRPFTRLSGRSNLSLDQHGEYKGWEQKNQVRNDVRALEDGKNDMLPQQGIVVTTDMAWSSQTRGVSESKLL